LRVLAENCAARFGSAVTRPRKSVTTMKLKWRISRRSLLTWLGAGAAGLVFAGQARAEVAPHGATPLPSFTGPGVNPYWNGVNPFVSYPQKLPLLRMTDRGIQLETPRQYFLTPFTPNAAFYVRYHLDLISNAVDLSTWRLSLEGNVERPALATFGSLPREFRGNVGKTAMCPVRISWPLPRNSGRGDRQATDFTTRIWDGR